MRAVVFGDEPRLALRTERVCARLGVETCRAPTFEAALARARRGGEGTWLLRAGAWSDATSAPSAPPRSATGKPLVAIGATRAAPHREDDADAIAWGRWLSRTGGDGARAREYPPMSSLWIEPSAAELFASSATPERALASARGVRVVRLRALDVMFDASLRVVEIVTSLQQGGAERVVIDLVRGLRACGVPTLPVTTGRPTRAAFAAPHGTLDLGELRGDLDAQADAVARAVRGFGADVVHAHLLTRAMLEALARRRIGAIVTVHNARPGWPSELDLASREAAPLLLACSNAIGREVRSVMGRAVRTIHNGIDPATMNAAPEPRATRRASFGAAASDIVLLAVANPRPQKRLHLLAPIARAVMQRTRRPARIALAGAPSSVHADAQASHEELVAGCAREGVPLALLGSVDALGPVYRAADVLVSTSAWEGLSLAQLEALACGLPVVASDVGGAREIPGVRVVHADASADAYAAEIAAALEAPAPSLGAELHASASARRHAAVLERAATLGAPRRGVLLVTNNFSTGGAQSSARRLLLSLREANVHAWAVVLQEQAAWPTPGRRALEQAGVRVLAAPDATTHDPQTTVRAVLEAVDRDPPEAVVFWNAIPEHKVRLADALLGARVFDVSPGEMYFASLERWFTRARRDPAYREPHDYGALLAGVVVKYAAEADRARSLGAPVHVIPNGVDLGPEPRPRAPRERLIFGTSARVAPQKRLEDLIAAVERAAPRGAFELRVAGGPEIGSERYAEELRRASRDLPVRWLGEVHDVRAFLDDLDAFAMVSEPAGCPNASLEAMAAGLPIVATDVGGAREQLEGAGLLVTPRDPAAMAEAMLDLARDPTTRARLGAAARARARERFTTERMRRDWLALLRLSG